MDKIKWAKYQSKKALKSKIKSNMFGVSLAILGQVFKISHASGPKKKKENLKQKQYCNKFNKDF